jgi:predicted ABC-type ATPase
VPAVDVRRRFYRGIYNFFKFYKPLADTWLLFNNADVTPRLIAREKDGKTEIIDKVLFDRIIRVER